MQPELPSVVLLDEPELGLHPAAIGYLAGLLRSASKRAQVIVSTQSVTLVNQLEPDDLVVANREQEASVFRRLTSAEVGSWLDDQETLRDPIPAGGTGLRRMRAECPHFDGWVTRLEGLGR